MRTVMQGRENLIRLWRGRADPKETYRLMRYQLLTDSEEGSFLLNTVTGELIGLDAADQTVLSRLPAPYSRDMDELIAHRCLVPERFNEAESVDQLRKLIRNLESGPEIRSFSILPTTACNARCFYCFESNTPRCSMTPETAERIAGYIDAHCGRKRRVTLKWFGGEPTLGEARIDQICSRLTEMGIAYTSSMISNAYLFSDEMVRKAKKLWKLTTIQITLDGTEEIYNRTKSYLHAEGSPYRRVMENIGLLLRAGIRVIVRMNLDQHNAEDLVSLTDELTERFSGLKGFSAYASPLFEDVGFDPVRHDASERSELTAAAIRLNERLEQNGCRASRFGWQKELPCLRTFYCMADNPHSLQINPRGEFSKCEHELFDLLVGDLEKGHDYCRENGRYWLNPSYRKACRPCPLYPVCGISATCGAAVDCAPEQIRERISDMQRLIQRKCFQKMETAHCRKEETEQNAEAGV